MTPAFLRASLNGELHEAETLLSLSLPDTWPEERRVLELRLEQLESDEALQPWLLRAMRSRETGRMIGHIGFHTAPGPEYLEAWAAGGVEFGCTVFSSFQRQGYAIEAAEALMHWAHNSHGVADFVVTVGRENAASAALASALGFERIGSHVDEIDGLEDILIRRWNNAA